MPVAYATTPFLRRVARVVLPLLHRYYGLLRHPVAHPNALAAVGTGTPETMGLPRFLVVPHVLLLRSLTPVGPDTVVMAGAGRGPRNLVNEGTNDQFSFEAFPSASALAANASQPGLPPNHAWLASGW